MIMSDMPIRQVDVVLFFGRARGDDNESLFKLVAEMYRSGRAKNILINGSKGEKQGRTIPGESWAGGQAFAERLIKLGVKKERIHFFNPSYNTTEAGRNMISYCMKMGWKTAVIAAQPHQLLRCLAGRVIAMKTTPNKNEGNQPYMMRIYSIAPRSVHWFENCAGSHGQYDMPRHDHIGLEYSRIQEYIFDLATLEEVFEYYQMRESIKIAA